MLILSRKPGEKVVIGPQIVITVVATSEGRVKLGIEAPAEVAVHREEVHLRLQHQADGTISPLPPLHCESPFFAEFA